MKLDIEKIRTELFPRIECRKGKAILVLSPTVLMMLPPLDSPIAQAAFSAKLPPHLHQQLVIARFKRISQYESSDLVELIEALEQASAST